MPWPSGMRCARPATERQQHVSARPTFVRCSLLQRTSGTMLNRNPNPRNQRHESKASDSPGARASGGRTMTNRDMLYRAILSSPADDAPRLMYADEIADEQPERAAFIRVQCELARTNHAGDCRCSGPDKWTRPECTCEWGRLDNQSGILEFAERRRVFAGIKLDYAGDLTSQFQRGFLA